MRNINFVKFNRFRITKSSAVAFCTRRHLWSLAHTRTHHWHHHTHAHMHGRFKGAGRPSRVALKIQNPSHPKLWRCPAEKQHSACKKPGRGGSSCWSTCHRHVWHVRTRSCTQLSILWMGTPFMSFSDSCLVCPGKSCTPVQSLIVFTEQPCECVDIWLCTNRGKKENIDYWRCLLVTQYIIQDIVW